MVVYCDLELFCASHGVSTLLLQEGGAVQSLEANCCLFLVQAPALLASHVRQDRGNTTHVVFVLYIDFPHVWLAFR